LLFSEVWFLFDTLWHRFREDSTPAFLEVLFF
jgi:hypothetical protein